MKMKIWYVGSVECRVAPPYRTIDGVWIVHWNVGYHHLESPWLRVVRPGVARASKKHQAIREAHVASRAALRRVNPRLADVLALKDLMEDGGQR